VKVGRCSGDHCVICSNKWSIHFTVARQDCFVIRNLITYLDAMSRYGPGGKYNYSDLQQFVDRGQWTEPAMKSPRSWNPPVGHGVYLFIRFPVLNTEVAAQTTVLAGRYVGGYRGEFVGIARKIHDLSSGPRRDEALIMYLFESHETAERFFISDSRFKQPDFPDMASSCEAWTMVKYRDTAEQEMSSHATNMLCYTVIRGCTFHQYRDQVANPLGALIEEHGGLPFVVQNVGVNSLRRSFIGNQTMVTLHLFKTEADCKNMMSDPRYEVIKRRQMQLAEDTTSVFTIDHRACP